MILIISLIIFLAVIALLVWMQNRNVTFPKRVFAATVLGVAFGLLLKALSDAATITKVLHWIEIVGQGYINLLQMIIMPLIFVTILSAIIKMKDSGKGLGKMTFLILGLLIGTTIIATLVGIVTANTFGLTIEGMQMGAVEATADSALSSKLASIQTVTFAQRLIELIPTNVFLDFTGSRNTSTIGVVIFTSFLGVAAMGIKKKQPESFNFFTLMIKALHDVVMRLVTMVLRLTPYGILAMMTTVVATNSMNDFFNLGKFVIASYVALLVMFVIHLLLISIVKVNPFKYVKKVFPVLTFAFTSRSSAGTIPLNIETQIKVLGIDVGTANLSATLGASIGHNGCAAIFPAMLAIMIAPSVGVDSTNIEFILKLIIVIAISSVGVAGVGGGAIFSALIVLSSINFPLALVGLLISIDPLLDMGRTSLNVNGAITSGVITSRLLGSFDMKIFKTIHEVDKE